MANPFLDRSFHIRWSQLTAEQAGPAIEYALAEAAQAIARIETLPLGQVDYTQTFLALENAPDLLGLRAEVHHVPHDEVDLLADLVDSLPGAPEGVVADRSRREHIACGW